MYVVFNFSIIYIYFLVWNKTGSGKRKKGKRKKREWWTEMSKTVQLSKKGQISGQSLPFEEVLRSGKDSSGEF